jgi:hypothetical protein
LVWTAFFGGWVTLAEADPAVGTGLLSQPDSSNETLRIREDTANQRIDELYQAARREVIEAVCGKDWVGAMATSSGRVTTIVVPCPKPGESARILPR